MNLLQFLEMGVVETLLLSISCLVLVFAPNGLGALFIKGKNRACLQTTAGLSLIAVLTLIAASYCAILAKFIIYICVSVSLILTIYGLHKERPSMRSIVKSVAPVLVVYTCFVVLLMSYIFTHEGTVDYNPHMIYCSAIPEEIYRADYFSRLRVTDVYPYEWSKFHLFNGCVSAIPLAVFPWKNIVTFNLAKYAVIALLIGTIYEGLVRKYGFKRAAQLSVIIMSIFVVGANRFALWTLAINNYSSFLIMGILWLIMQEKDYSNAAMFSMILAVSTSKSTITGFLLFLFCLFMLFKANGNSIKAMLLAESSAALYCLIIGFGCIAMVVSGEQPANERLLLPDFIGNATNASWVGMFFFGDSLNAFIQTKSIRSLGWAVVMPILYAVVIAMRRKRIMNFLKEHFKIVIYAAILVLSLYVMYWMHSHDDTIAISGKFFIIPLQFLFLYLLPIVCIFSCCEKYMRAPLQLFVVFSFVQFMILNEDNGACNYCMLMFPLALYIANSLIVLLKRIPSTLSCILFVMLFCGTLYYALNNDIYRIFVLSQGDRYHSTIELSDTEYLGNIAYEYDDPDDVENVKLNSLKGNRVHYEVRPNQFDSTLGMLSMSMRFIPVSDYLSSNLK